MIIQEKITKKVIHDIGWQCDICNIIYPNDHRTGAEDFAHIYVSAGYNNDSFDDMDLIQCDICPKCLKEHLGLYLRITKYNG